MYTFWSDTFIINLTSSLQPLTHNYISIKVAFLVFHLNKWFHHLLERPKICFYIICSLAFALMSLFQLSLTVCAFLQPYQTTYAGLPKEMCSWLSLCILLPSSFPDSSNSGFNSTRQLYLPNFLQLNQLALIFLLMHLQPCLTGLMVILTTCLSKTSL